MVISSRKFFKADRYRYVVPIFHTHMYGYMYGWLKVAVGIFCLGKPCCRHLLPSGMFVLQPTGAGFTTAADARLVFQ